MAGSGPAVTTACITGASGFIGQRLVASLTDSRQLTCIPHQNIATAEIGNPEEFYFLSSYGNLFSQNNRDMILRANVTDLLQILRQLNAGAGCKAFVYLSSSSVNLRFQTVYSRAKRAAEEVLIALLETEGFPAIIIRPFSVTGVGEQPAHLIPTLISSCFTGAQVDFVPEPTHDFIDVEDVVDGILALVNKAAYGVFSLGSGTQYSNAQVLEIVESLSGRKANIKIVDSMRPYDTDDWVSTSQDMSDSGWQPSKSLEQSIAEMIDTYRVASHAE